MIRRLIVPALLALALAGCKQAADAPAPQAAKPAADTPPAPAPEGTPPPNAADGKPLEQVLVKRGTLELVVTDAAAAEARIQELLKTYGGFVAGRESRATVPEGKGLSPSVIHAVTLTLKVDARKFDLVLAKLKELGSFLNEQIQVDDVTFAFVDLNARLANQKRVEERLLAHLLEVRQDVKAVVEVERELGRVREQIETLTAQLRVLQDQIAYSTITVHLAVRPDWIPPEERTFGDEIGGTLKASMTALGVALRGLAVVFVALLPWIVPVVVIGGVVVWVVRRRKR
jgi:hypothetical protein